MSTRFNQPGDEHAFEETCLRYYRNVSENESLALYGKRGERQHGVDIYDPIGKPPYYAIQCKHIESRKKIDCRTIEAEVEKAERFPHKIGMYIIATTAQKSRKSQDCVATLNARPSKPFDVRVDFSEDICERLSQLNLLVALNICYGRHVANELLSDVLAGHGRLSTGCRVLALQDTPISGEIISEVEELLLNRNLDAAKHEIGKLPNGNELDRLNDDEQYNILRLRGKMALETGDFESASAFFLSAYEKKPDLHQAQCNQVLAYSLVSQPEKAYQLAEQYVRSGNISPAMLCRLIDNAPTREAIEENRHLLTSHLETDEDLNLALFHRLMHFKDISAALPVSRRAIAIAPDSPHASFAVACAHHTTGLKGDWTSRKNSLFLAIQHYDDALTRAREKKYHGLIPEVLVNRASVRALLGDDQRALADYDAAIEAATTPSLYAPSAVLFCLDREDYIEAERFLPDLDHRSLEGKYLTAITRFSLSEHSDSRRENLAVMRGLADSDWERAVECRFHAIQWTLSIGDLKLAREIVPEPFLKAHPFQGSLALAWIAIVEGDRDIANAMATKACNSDIRGDHPQELWVLATLLGKLGRHAEALDILLLTYVPGKLDHVAKRLITTAQTIHRDDLLLRVCRELRHTGEQDEQLRRIEMQLLFKYMPERAFEVSEEFIRESEDPAYFTAFRNLIAVQLRLLNELRLDPSALPAPSKLAPDEAFLVVKPYMVAGKIDEALAFLCEQLRAHFGDYRSHESFSWFFGKDAGKSALTKRPETVQLHSAVQLEHRDRKLRWVIIEPNSPSTLLSEYGESSEYSRRLLGRSVGDVVEIADGPLQSQVVTIRRIETKYVYRFNECLERFQERFPGALAIQGIQADQGQELAVMATVLSERRAHIDRCLELYRQELCPLFFFAHTLGANELDTTEWLAGRSDGLVRCAYPTQEEYCSASVKGIRSKLVILDLSALITLALLNEWSVLPSGHEYVVSRATNGTIMQWIDDARDEEGREGGHASVDECGRLRYQELSVDHRRDRVERLQAIKTAMDSRCLIRSAESVLAISPEQREKSCQLIGLHHLESICLARESGGILWTDDYAVALIARSEFGVETVWTQLAFNCFEQSGAIEADRFAGVSAKLVAWNYHVTNWGPDTIIAAGQIADWKPNRWPLEQCLRAISNAEFTRELKVGFGLHFLKLLRRSSCVELMQSQLIQHVLDILREQRVVRDMLAKVDPLFGVDVASSHFVRVELELWLQHQIAVRYV